ncbi:hypothetical protein QUA86_22695 [Microcoleus sp. F6_B6]
MSIPKLYVPSFKTQQETPTSGTVRKPLPLVQQVDAEIRKNHRTLTPEKPRRV